MGKVRQRVKKLDGVGPVDNRVSAQTMSNPASRHGKRQKKIQ